MKFRWEGASARKISSRTSLARRREELRRQGKRVVLTNGCFDLLHVGHVRYLEMARSMGDVLIVGVNSDASVRRLKGPGRPINTESDRAEVLAALACVDAVTVFDEDTAVELAAAIQPDVYIKGGDYSADPEDARFPVEGHVVRAAGGEVGVVQYVPGRSTTEIIRRAGPDITPDLAELP